MGVAHHSVYPIWMEMARTEMLRCTGVSYAELEARGMLIVVVKLSIQYRRPARYDDALIVHAKLSRVSPAKIEHDYEILRDGQLLCTASTVLACVDRSGRPQRVPDLFHSRSEP
jgi:acyl-CoA thioester hydrolase